MKDIKNLTIEDYMRLQLIYSTYEGDLVRINKEIVKYICGSLDIPKKQLDEILSELNYLVKTTDYDFIQRFTYNGVEYGFIPCLDDLTAGEFIDLDEYMKDANNNLNKIAAILYRPVTKTMGKLYDIEKYESATKYSEVMKNVNFQVILGAIVFFCNLSNSLLKHSLISIQKESKKKENQTR